jgi:cytochrome c oxidase cbb3-type subunit III
MDYYVLDSPIRRISLRCAAVLVVCLFGSFHGPPAKAQTAGTTVKSTHQSNNLGRQLFESNCAGCHGLDGRGGERGPDISKRQQVVQLSDSEIAEILRGGKIAAGMPPFEQLGEPKLKALLVYLRSLQGKGETADIPGNASNGKSLFFGKARCSECHMVQGAGGFLGRDLSVYGATLSAAEIRSNILRGNNTNKANKTAVITMRDSSKFTGIIRNEDNFSIQLQSLDGTFHFLTRSEVANAEFLPAPIMPSDYSTTLKPAEIDDLVSYLVTASRTTRAKNKTEDEDDN